LLFHRNRQDKELDEELRDHIDRQIEENLARGMGAEAARLAALQAFEIPSPCASRRTIRGAGVVWNCC
jgi:hypothetical protein